MNGQVILQKLYFNEAYLGNNAMNSEWTKELVEGLIGKASRRAEMNYGAEGLKIHDAVQKYWQYVQGRSGIVVGSESPWVEAILLHYGASNLTTVEFGKINSGHPQIRTMIPTDFTEGFINGSIKPFDFGLSYSSVEHDGLGRYGDVLNPIADLQTMAKMLNVIRPGGLFFVGVPTHLGEDTLVFNAHRIYGRLRLPKLFAGWRLVDVMHEPDSSSWYPFTQHVWVLQNVNGCVTTPSRDEGISES